MPPHKKVTPWLWFVWIFLYVSSFYVCGHARPLCEAKRTVQRSSHAVGPAATPEVRASDPMVRPLVTRCVQLSTPCGRPESAPDRPRLQQRRRRPIRARGSGKRGAPTPPRAACMQCGLEPPKVTSHTPHTPATNCCAGRRTTSATHAPK